ncbi:hypothetical protein E2562_032015 [Oryza meyeriana var. granulata]|uniref:Uncharacterized protein n=1 Tax=Oryza meyeriana var. granulata TaxID=110450 RepID=A0A6G1FEK5_9ORYZ|nr:hypothetical protein E2562_032015 [Oryza meyeriana var. granulata]
MDLETWRKSDGGFGDGPMARSFGTASGLPVGQQTASPSVASTAPTYPFSRRRQPPAGLPEQAPCRPQSPPPSRHHHACSRRNPDRSGPRRESPPLVCRLVSPPFRVGVAFSLADDDERGLTGWPARWRAPGTASPDPDPSLSRPPVAARQVSIGSAAAATCPTTTYI